MSFAAVALPDYYFRPFPLIFLALVFSPLRNPVKNRAVPPSVLSRYSRKVCSLEAEAKRVEEEERAEREIAALENRSNI